MEEVLAFLNNQRKDIKETQQNLYPGLIYFTYFYNVSALLKKKYSNFTRTSPDSAVGAREGRVAQSILMQRNAKNKKVMLIFIASITTFMKKKVARR